MHTDEIEKLLAEVPEYRGDFSFLRLQSKQERVFPIVYNTFPVEIDSFMPVGEIQFSDKNNNVVAKVVNIGV